MSIKFIMCIPGLLLVTLPAVAAMDKDGRHDMEGRQEMQQNSNRMNDRMKDREEGQNRMRDEKNVYGWRLMSPEERRSYQKEMRSLESRQEQEAYMKKHRERMEKKANDMGVDLQKDRGRG